MQIRQLETNQDIEDIKNIVEELSFSENNLNEGFQDYPVENLDIFKDFIIQSPLSLGAFEDQKMLAFIVAYDIKNILSIDKAQDPLLQYLLQKKYLENKSFYVDILGAIKTMQNRGIGINLLKKILSYAKQNKYKEMRCAVCIDSHGENSSIYKILKYIGSQEFEKITDSKGNHFIIYKMDLE